MPTPVVSEGSVFILSPIAVYRNAILDEVCKLYPLARGFASMQDLPDRREGSRTIVVLIADVVDDATRAVIARLHETFEDLQLVLLASLGDARIEDFSGAAPIAALLAPDSTLDMLIDVLALIERSSASVVPRTILDRTDVRQAGSETPADMPLSPREVDVILRLTHGRSNKEIARDLDMAEPTVRAHIRSILVKLNFNNRTQATVWAIRNGLDRLPHEPASPVSTGQEQGPLDQPDA